MAGEGLGHEVEPLQEAVSHDREVGPVLDLPLVERGAVRRREREPHPQMLAAEARARARCEVFRAADEPEVERALNRAPEPSEALGGLLDHAAERSSGLLAFGISCLDQIQAGMRAPEGTESP